MTHSAHCASRAARELDILGLFSSPLVEPDGTSIGAIDVEAELGVIMAAIEASKRTVRFEKMFATADTVALCAARHAKVIHFGGHGFPGGIYLESACGKSVMTTDVWGALCSAFSDSP